MTDSSPLTLVAHWVSSNLEVLVGRLQQRRPDQAEQLRRAVGGDDALLLDPSTLAAAAGVLDRALPGRADGRSVDVERIDASGAARVAALHHRRGERLEPPDRGMEEGASNGLYLLVREIDPDLIPPGRMAVMEDIDARVETSYARDVRPDDIPNLAREAVAHHAYVLAEVTRQLVHAPAGTAGRARPGRVERAGRVRLADAAIMMHQRQAMEGSRADVLDGIIPSDQVELAVLYLCRFYSSHRRKDLDHAVDQAERAVAASRGTHQQARADDLLENLLEDCGTMPGARPRHPRRSGTDQRRAAELHRASRQRSRAWRLLARTSRASR